MESIPDRNRVWENRYYQMLSTAKPCEYLIYAIFLQKMQSELQALLKANMTYICVTHGHRYTHFPNMNGKILLLSHLCILKLPNFQEWSFRTIPVSFSTEQWVFTGGWAAGSLLPSSAVYSAYSYELRQHHMAEVQRTCSGGITIAWESFCSYKHDHSHVIWLEILYLSFLKCLDK